MEDECQSARESVVWNIDTAEFNGEKKWKNLKISIFEGQKISYWNGARHFHNYFGT